jgi:hypothetical protein
VISVFVKLTCQVAGTCTEEQAGKEWRRKWAIAVQTCRRLFAFVHSACSSRTCHRGDVTTSHLLLFVLHETHFQCVTKIHLQKASLMCAVFVCRSSHHIQTIEFWGFRSGGAESSVVLGTWHGVTTLVNPDVPPSFSGIWVSWRWRPYVSSKRRDGTQFSKHRRNNPEDLPPQ